MVAGLMFHFPVVGKDFANPDYYLIDSLNKDDLSAQDQHLLDSALQIYHERKHDTSEVYALSMLSENLLHHSWEQYSELMREKVYEKLNDRESGNQQFFKKMWAGVLGNKGFAFYENGDVDSALFYFEKADRIFKELGTKGLEARNLLNIAMAYDYYSEYDRGLGIYFKVLPILESLDDAQAVAVCFNNIGHDYMCLKQDEKAIKYFEKVLNLPESIVGPEIIADALHNVGTIHQGQKQFKEARSYFLRSIAYREEYGMQHGLPEVYCSLGSVYLGLGQLDSTRKYYLESIELYQQRQNKDGLARSLEMMADFYLVSGHLGKAEEYGVKALDLARELKVPAIITQNAFTLIKIYRGQKKFEEAIQIYDLYYVTQQEIYKKETNDNLYKYEASLANYKKEQQGSIDKKNIEILEKEKLLRNYTIVAILLIVIIVALVLLMGFNKFRREQLKKEIKASHQIEIQLKEIDVLKTNISTLIQKETESFSSAKVEIDFDRLNEILATPLSEREQRVLRELSMGNTNKAMAENLCVSVNTIKTQLSSIYSKLNVKNRTQAVNTINSIVKEK